MRFSPFCAISLLLLCSPVVAAFSAAAAPAGRPAAAQPAPIDINQLKARVDANPQDARVHYMYGDGLQKLGRLHEATREFVTATELDPSLFHAYHQLSIVTSEKHILDQAISRLNYLKEEKPTDMLLRVALSELYEKKGDYYQANKTLVDLVYTNSVPPKYVDKINSRIRSLQARAKDTHGLDRTQPHNQDEFLDSAPPPLPESQLNRDLSISKVKESQTMQGFGHATLLP